MLSSRWRQPQIALYELCSSNGRKLTLVLMAGLPGAGKTTLALKLGATLHWPVLSKDTLRSSLMMVEVVERVAGFAAYELLFALAYDLLVQQQISIILDCSSVYPFILHRSIELARKANAQLRVVRCAVDSAVRSQRLGERNNGAISTAPLSPALTSDEEQRLFTHLPHDTLVLQTVDPLEAYLPEVIAYLFQSRSS